MAPRTETTHPTRSTGSSHRRSVLRAAAAVVLLAVVALTGFLVSPARPADASTTSLLNCEFGKFQVFDVQWNISGGFLHVSGIQPPYSSNPSPHPLTVNPPNPSPELLDTDYFKFVATSYVVPDPNPGGETAIGFEQYASNGTVKLRMDDFGVFQAYGPGFIFYVGEGSWGTVITTGVALEYGSSADLPVTREASPGNPITEADMLGYQCQGSPLPPPGSVVITAPTAAMTAGDPMPTLTPTVDPVAGLTQQPTCAVYAASDTSFTTPLVITADSPGGTYVTHCSGAVLAADYGPAIYVDSEFTVTAAPVPETTTTTTTVEEPTTIVSTTEAPASAGLPSTGQNSTVPMALFAVVLLSWGGYLALSEWGRRPILARVHAFRSTDSFPSVESIILGPTAAPVAGPVIAEPVVEAPVADAHVGSAVVEAPADDGPVTVAAAPVPTPVAPVDEVAPVSTPAPRSVSPARFAIEQRLALLEGRTDRRSLQWAGSLRAQLADLDD